MAAPVTGEGPTPSHHTLAASHRHALPDQERATPEERRQRSASGAPAAAYEALEQARQLTDELKDLLRQLAETAGRRRRLLRRANDGGIAWPEIAERLGMRRESALRAAREPRRG